MDSPYHRNIHVILTKSPQWRGTSNAYTWFNKYKNILILIQYFEEYLTESWCNFRFNNTSTNIYQILLLRLFCEKNSDCVHNRVPFSQKYSWKRKYKRLLLTTLEEHFIDINNLQMQTDILICPLKLKI